MAPRRSAGLTLVGLGGTDRGFDGRAHLDGTAIVLLSLGGALGLLGYARAVRGARNPRRHNDRPRCSSSRAAS